jgi:gentisate 1,2-dioxygenase
MQELGRLEDLPANYREALTRQNLVPLWPKLRAVLPPGKPQPSARLRLHRRQDSFAPQARSS